MKRSTRVFAVRACAAWVWLAFAGQSVANPDGPSVISGQAGFQTQGNTLSVTNSPGAIIQWRGFSIGRDEVTRFLQQSSVSAVLNRVTGGNPSDILGRLSSNGRVYLINPSGITFGAGAVIDVAGLVASTLNLSNADFIAGRHRFQGSGAEGKLVNQGNIITPAGGNVFLVAPQVENAGVIRAPGGEIVLAAGATVHLVDSAFPSIRVEVSAPQNRSLNLGNLSTAGAGKVFAFLVKQSGVASASNAQSEGGKVAFRSAGEVQLAAGSVTEATGATGGSVQVGGESVRLASLARIDVSGTDGGGVALIGGGPHGADPAVPNAKITIVEPGAVIKANATERGDGGAVVVYAEGSTQFSGAIEARGGDRSGDGGKVEVSGRDALAFAGTVDTRAPHGVDGTLLIDPTRITVTAAATGVPAGLGDAFWQVAEDTGPQVLGAVDLSALLNTTSVTLEATERITIAADAQITVASGAARSLTLQAPEIVVQGTLRASGGPLELNLTAPGGSVNIAAAAEISLAGGKLNFAAQSVAVSPQASFSQGAAKGSDLQNPRIPVETARAATTPPDVARLRAEVEAELSRDRERLAAAMHACAKPGATLRQGCAVSSPLRKFVFAG